MMSNVDNMSPADLAAVMGNNNNGGFMGGDGSAAWWILILLLFANNGWNGNGNNNGNNGYGMPPYMYGMMPQMATQDSVNAGFAQMSIMNGIGDITNAISNGFANSEISRTNMLSGLTGQISGLAMGQQQGFYNTQGSIKDLAFNVATEACADRQAVNDGVRDLMAQNTQNTNALLNTITNGIQTINDKLCQQEIEALKSQNANLQTQLNLANLKGSQDAQTAQLMADNAAQTANLIRTLNPAPIPAFITNPPYNCGCNNGFNGCGCGN